MGHYDDIKNVKNYINMSKKFYVKELVSKLSDYLENGSTILELGMGPGNDYKILEKDFRVTGSDKHAHFIDIYKKNNPESDVVVMDAITMNTEIKFDCIYSNKVLFQLNKMELDESIKNQWTRLNENGIIFHTFWKGNKIDYYRGIRYQYYLEKELSEKFQQYFDLLLTESYKEFTADDSILIILKRKEM